jgi:hypothetical protein
MWARFDLEAERCTAPKSPVQAQGGWLLVGANKTKIHSNNPEVGVFRTAGSA